MVKIVTPRLSAESLSEADWPFFLALEQNQEVMRYVDDSRPECAIREAFESRLPHWTPGAAHWLCLLVRETATGMPVGLTGYIHREPDCAEVGFLFAPEAHGKGFATESLQAVCDFAFTRGEIRRLIATVTVGNSASRRVLEKAGFVLEGERRESYLIGGKWHNDWVLGLLRHEYQRPSP
ncbi:GNAT family N-acetyltransferase [Citrobacter sp. OP27]|jgi:RimJ/RimL family protein N-acetyltransferase